MLYPSFEDAGIIIPRGASGDIKLPCPQCQGDRRTHKNDRPLYLNVEKQTWRCYHCDFRGGIKQRDGVIFEKPQPAPPKPPQPIREGVTHPDVYGWFAARGISAAVVDRNRVTGDGREIHFPFFRDGAHVNTQYRTYNPADPHDKAVKDFRMDGGALVTFYGLDDVAGHDTWIITEGMVDKLAIEAATGITNIVSVPNGSGTKLDKVLPSVADQLKTVKRFILAGDTDEKGAPFMDELSRRLSKERCWRVRWPANDANATLLEWGPEAVQAALDDATPEPIDGVIHLNDLRADVLALRHQPHALGTPMLAGRLGDLVRIAGGMTMTLSGVPGSGKSRLMDNIIVYTAIHHGWRWAVCSPESWPLKLHAKHLIQIYAGAPLNDFPEIGMPGMSERAVLDALDKLNRNITLVKPDVMSLDGIMATMDKVVLSEGVNGIVLDPWNRLGHRTPSGMSMTNYVGMALAEIKNFSQHRDVFTGIVAHPRKPDAGREEEGGFVSIKPYDIADSHNFYDMSDFIVTVARNKLDLHAGTKISVSKVKTEEYGEVGSAVLFYDPYTGRMGDQPWR